MNGGGEPLSTPAQLVRSFDSERPRVECARALMRSLAREFASAQRADKWPGTERHRAYCVTYVTHPPPWNRPLVIPRELACPRAFQDSHARS